MIIRLSGAKNARDFSEYGYKDHIRSAHLNKLTGRDIDILRSRYDLRTVIDLRTTKETEEKPDVTIPDTEYIHIPIFEGAVPGVSHEKETDKLGSVIPDMPKMYELLVTEDIHVRQIRKVMEIITDPDRKGAVLWHCTEGKDRCGIISALFLLSKGIQPDEVMKDYLVTNRTNRSKARMLYFLVMLSGRGREFAASVSDAFLAKQEYLGPIMDTLIRLSEEYSESPEKAGQQEVWHN